MRQTYNLSLPSAVTDTACLAASQRGMTLPDGSPAVALEIDNRSGFWLQVYPGGSQIKPYAVGVVVSFVTDAPSVDLLFAAVGPANQVSTLAGGAVTVTLYDAAEAPDGSEGAPFIEAFTPTLAVNQSFTSSFGGTGNANLLPAVPGMRYRLFSVAYQIEEDILTPVDSRATGVILSGGSNPLVLLFLVSPAAPIDRAVFSTGIDCPIGQAVQYNGTGEWASVPTRFTVTYQLV